MKRVLAFLILITLIGLASFVAGKEQEELERRKAVAKVITGEISPYYSSMTAVRIDEDPIYDLPIGYAYFLNQEDDLTVSILYDINENLAYFICFNDTLFEEGIKKKISDLKLGKVEAKNIEEIAIKFNASQDDKYLTNPPIDGPSDENQYYFWPGTLNFKQEDLYIVWDSGVDAWGTAYRGGFAFKNIKKRFKDMQARRRVDVVGRYIGNTEITLTNGQIATIPVLTDCYVQ